MQDVGRRMAAGAVWMVLFKLAERGLGFVSTLILARLLVPADFGLVAMATSFIALLELLSAFGFDVALIRTRDPSRQHYDTAWTFNVLVAGAVALALVLFAGAIAAFYRAPEVQSIIYVLAAGSFVQGFENIGVVAFRREMDFGREFRFQIGKKIAMFAVTIPLALLLRSYWALIAGMVAGRFAGVALSFWVHPFRPRLSLAARRDLFGFSKWLLVNNALTFLRERSSDFIIGRLVGPRALGLYSIAYEIANLPTTELVMPINRAVYPGYARIWGELGALRAGFGNVIGVIALFAVPAGAGVAATAAPLTLVALGSQWAQAAPLIQILAFFGVLMALQTNSYSVFLAIGKPRLQTVVIGAYLAALLPLMIVLTRSHGPEGAAWACLVSGLVMLPVNYLLVMRELKISVGQLLALVWRPILAAAVMYFVVRAMLGAVPESAGHWRPVLQLGAAIPAGMAAYFGLVYVLWVLAGRPAGAERMVIDRLMRSRAPGENSVPPSDP